MPTGYTAAIGDNENLTFREFALSCARAFGACIMQGDDPIGTPINMDEKPGEYCATSLKEAESDLARYKAMSLDEAEGEQKKEREAIESSAKKSRDKSMQLRDRYERMLRLVQAWSPPTPDHAGMKDFMEKQILESVGFDCHDGSYYEDQLSKQPIDTNRWLENKIEESIRRVRDRREYKAKEEAAYASRNEWKRQLVASLEASP